MTEEKVYSNDMAQVQFGSVLLLLFVSVVALGM